MDSINWLLERPPGTHLGCGCPPPHLIPPPDSKSGYSWRVLFLFCFERRILLCLYLPSAGIIDIHYHTPAALGMNPGLPACYSSSLPIMPIPGLESLFLTLTLWVSPLNPGFSPWSPGLSVDLQGLVGTQFFFLLFAGHCLKGRCSCPGLLCTRVLCQSGSHPSSTPPPS